MSNNNFILSQDMKQFPTFILMFYNVHFFPSGNSIENKCIVGIVFVQ